MIKVRYLVLARRGIVDIIRENLSIIDIAEEITSSQFPAGLLDHSLIAVFNRGHDVKGKIFKAIFHIHFNNVLVGSVEQDIDLLKARFNRTIITIPALQFPEPGELLFEVSLGNKVIASEKIAVVQTPPKE